VSDSIVQSSINEAARNVDATWTEGDYTNAIILRACHILKLEGYPVVGGVVGGMSAYKSFRSGQLSLTKYAKGEQGGDDGSLLGSTMYGRRFLELLYVNKTGIAVIAGPTGEASGFAKDWPL
jgi:hypothetical protein